MSRLTKHKKNETKTPQRNLFRWRTFVLRLPLWLTLWCAIFFFIWYVLLISINQSGPGAPQIEYFALFITVALTGFSCLVLDCEVLLSIQKKSHVYIGEFFLTPVLIVFIGAGASIVAMFIMFFMPEINLESYLHSHVIYFILGTVTGVIPIALYCIYSPGFGFLFYEESESEKYWMATKNLIETVLNRC